MNKKEISVIIVTFNSARYLPFLFDSLEKQTSYQDLEIIVVDNDSKDGTLDFLRKRNDIKLIENKENKGFAGGNNQGFEIATGKYVFCLNHDVILEQDYVLKLVLFLEENEKAGAVSGRIFKWDFQKKEKTKIVDTFGFKVFKSHKVIDQDSLNFNDEPVKEVFGVSAAAAIYRKTALLKLKKLSGHYFDPDFGSYKEDVDFAFRLRHAGYKSYVHKFARAYHDRWSSGRQDQLAGVKKSRKKRNPLINTMSYRNHFIVLSKNVFLRDIFWFFPYIFIFEFQKFFFFLIFEPKTILGLFQFIKQLPLTLKKRRDILSKSEVGPNVFYRWYC